MFILNGAIYTTGLKLFECTSSSEGKNIVRTVLFPEENTALHRAYSYLNTALAYISKAYSGV